MPESKVGRVIGHKSETLKSIAHKSNSKIFLACKNKQKESSDLEGRIIEVIGTEAEQKIAESLIWEAINGYHQAL